MARGRPRRRARRRPRRTASCRRRPRAGPGRPSKRAPAPAESPPTRWSRPRPMPDRRRAGSDVRRRARPVRRAAVPPSVRGARRRDHRCPSRCRAAAAAPGAPARERSRHDHRWAGRAVPRPRPPTARAARPARRRGPRPPPVGPAPGRRGRGCASTLSSTGWVHGRSDTASSGVSRWMVPRIVCSRTSAAPSSPRVTSCGSRPVSRACRERYGGSGSCACRPTRWSAIAAGVEAVRRQQVLPGEQRPVESSPGQPHPTMMLLVSSMGPGPSPPVGSSVLATKV